MDSPMPDIGNLSLNEGVHAIESMFRQMRELHNSALKAESAWLSNCKLDLRQKLDVAIKSAVPSTSRGYPFYWAVYMIDDIIRIFYEHKETHAGFMISLHRGSLRINERMPYAWVVSEDQSGVELFAHIAHLFKDLSA